MVRPCCEGALRRLQTDYLDLAVCEWSEVRRAQEDVIFSLSTLARAGILRCFAVAGFPLWRVMEAIRHAMRRNVSRPEVFQIDYSLLDRSPHEQDAMDLCQEYRLDLASATPAVEPGHSPWPAFLPNYQGRDTVGPKLTGSIGLGPSILASPSTKSES